MKIYFGLVDKTFDDNEGTFSHADNNYYFGLECGTNIGGTEEFTVFDGCDRMVPLSVEYLDDFIRALNMLKTHLENIEQGNRSQELLVSDAVEGTFDW